MSTVTRADLEAMDRDELIEAVLDLDRRVEDLEATVANNAETAAKGRSSLRRNLESKLDEEIGDLRDDLRQTERRVNHERAKLMRRVANLEAEHGFEPEDVIALAGSGGDLRESKLARLLDGGPTAIDDDATATLYRAEDLARNWIRWGESRRGRDGEVIERTLATTRDDLKTRLEDCRNESLSWRQVYRAMQKIADLGPENVQLREHDTAGKMLVQDLRGGER